MGQRRRDNIGDIAGERRHHPQLQPRLLYQVSVADIQVRSTNMPIYCTIAAMRAQLKKLRQSQ